VQITKEARMAKILALQKLSAVDPAAVLASGSSVGCHTQVTTGVTTQGEDSTCSVDCLL